MKYTLSVIPATRIAVFHWQGPYHAGRQEKKQKEDC